MGARKTLLGYVEEHEVTSSADKTIHTTFPPIGGVAVYVDTTQLVGDQYYYRTEKVPYLYRYESIHHIQ